MVKTSQNYVQAQRALKKMIPQWPRDRRRSDGLAILLDVGVGGVVLREPNRSGKMRGSKLVNGAGHRLAAVH